jgi:hypothetical protein
VDGGHPAAGVPAAGRLPGVPPRDAVRGGRGEQVLRLLPDLGRRAGRPDRAGRGHRLATRNTPLDEIRKLRLGTRNTPLDEIRKLRLGTPIPQFWLGAGTANKLDVANAEVFWQELSLRQASVPLILTRGGGHDMTTWRAEVPAMLAWMTPRLAQAAAAQAAAAKAPHPQPSGSLAAQHRRHRPSSPALAVRRTAAQHPS